MLKDIKINKKIIKLVLYLIIIVFVIYSVRIVINIVNEKIYVKKLKEKYPELNHYIDEVSKMSRKKRKGLLLMVGIKDKILSKETIKTLGVHNIEIKLFEGVVGKLRIDVISE